MRKYLFLLFIHINLFLYSMVAQENMQTIENVKLNVLEERTAKELFSYIEKSGLNNYYDFGICEAKLQKDENHNSEVVLYNVVKSLIPKIETITITQNSEDSVSIKAEYLTIAEYSSVANRPEGAIGNLFLQLYYNMGRTVFVDIQDIAKEYNLASLRVFLFGLDKSKSKFDELPRFKVKDVSIGLSASPFRSSLPLHMYPIEFLDTIVFENEGEIFNIVVRYPEMEESNNMSLVIPIGESSDAEAKLARFMKLLIKTDVQNIGVK